MIHGRNSHIGLEINVTVSGITKKMRGSRILQSLYQSIKRKGRMTATSVLRWSQVRNKVMDIIEFWDGIKLGVNHREAVLRMNFEKQECGRLYELYKKDHNSFFEEVLKKEESGLWFLWLYSHMACEVYDRYMEQGISAKIFWDTFQDIRFWCENAEREFGTMGLAVYEWFYRHIDMVLFRFGRLQFEIMEMENSIVEGEVCLEKGTPIVNVHIPQGEPLTWKACEKSLEVAKEYFGIDKPYVCHSWLLYPGLDEVLSEKSNIREFRKHFKVLQTDYKEREAEWRVFGKVLKNVVEYPEETSLQRRVKEYLLSGRVLGNGWAMLEG